MAGIYSRLSMGKTIFMRICYLIIVLLSFSACKNQEGTPVSDNGLPTDFEEFYKKFHKDTTFQLGHISFPLAGSPAMVDTLVVTDIPFFWEKDQWEYHRAFDPASQFDRSFIVLGPELINERYQHRELPLIMERRFAKTSDGWRLIYYSAPAPGKIL